MMLANGWRDFEDLMPKILPHAIQCTEGFALDHLRDAVIRACERARLWVVDDEFEMGCDTDVMIVAPKGSQLYQIDRVSIGNSFLQAVPSQEMYRVREQCHPGGRAHHFAQADNESIAIFPVQHGARIRVRAYLIPTADATRAPKVVLDRHREMLVNGALARILAVPAQPFTNIELAAYRDSLFERRLDEINREYVTGAQRGPLRTRPNYL